MTKNPYHSRSQTPSVKPLLGQASFGGNPATIVFFHQSGSLAQEERRKFGRDPDGPEVVFLTRPQPYHKPGVVPFDIQYLAQTHEYGLYGHGTIAAMEVTLGSVSDLGFGQENQLPVFSSPETHVVKFTSARRVVISARKATAEEDRF